MHKGKLFFWNAGRRVLVVPQEGARCCDFNEMGRWRFAPGDIGVDARVKYRGVAIRRARLHLREPMGSLCVSGIGAASGEGAANARNLDAVAASENLQETSSDFEVWGGASGAADGALAAERCGMHGNYAPVKSDLARFNTINSRELR